MENYVRNVIKNPAIRVLERSEEYQWRVVQSWISRRMTSLFLFHDYVIYQTGFFTNSKKIYNQDIKAIEIKQTILGRMFDYGKILIATSGTGDYELKTKSFASPYAIRNYLQTHRKEGE